FRNVKRPLGLVQPHDGLNVLSLEVIYDLDGVITQAGKNRQPALRVKGEMIDTTRNTRQRNLPGKYEGRTFAGRRLRRLLRDAWCRSDREHSDYRTKHWTRLHHSFLHSSSELASGRHRQLRAIGNEASTSFRLFFYSSHRGIVTLPRFL